MRDGCAGPLPLLDGSGADAQGPEGGGAEAWRRDWGVRSVVHLLPCGVAGGVPAPSGADGWASCSGTRGSGLSVSDGRRRVRGGKGAAGGCAEGRMGG